MQWRQSYTLCSGMPYELDAHPHYRAWETLRKIWRRRPTEFAKAPVEFFESSVVSLPKKTGYMRQFLCENWRDLRLAIEQSWNAKDPPEYVPFVLTTTFLNLQSRQKNAVERVLAEQEKLT